MMKAKPEEPRSVLICLIIILPLKQSLSSGRAAPWLSKTPF